MNLITRIAAVAVAGTTLAAGWTLLEEKTVVVVDGNPIKRDAKILMGAAALSAGVMVGIVAAFSE